MSKVSLAARKQRRHSRENPYQWSRSQTSDRWSLESLDRSLVLGIQGLLYFWHRRWLSASCKRSLPKEVYSCGSKPAGELRAPCQTPITQTEAPLNRVPAKLLVPRSSMKLHLAAVPCLSKQELHLLEEVPQMSSCLKSSQKSSPVKTT